MGNFVVGKLTKNFIFCNRYCCLLKRQMRNMLLFIHILISLNSAHFRLLSLVLDTANDGPKSGNYWMMDGSDDVGEVHFCIKRIMSSAFQKLYTL